MSPASPKLSFKTNRDRSVSSLLSIGVTHRTPKVARRGNGVTEEKTVTIRCQRLTADKRYEEVDVEVPGKNIDIKKKSLGKFGKIFKTYLDLAEFGTPTLKSL